TCTLGAVVVGAFCTIDVTYNPLAAGTSTAQLNVADNARVNPLVIPLSGTAVAPAAIAGVAPAALVFANQLKNTTSAPLPVTVLNTGNASLTVGVPAIGGLNPANFAVATNGCTLAVAAGSSCSITV